MTSEVPSTIWGWSTADTRNELGRRACDLHFPVLMPQGERVTEFSHSASEIQALVHVLNGKTRGNAASILHQYKSRGWKPRGQRTAWMNEQQGWIVGTLELNALRSLLKCYIPQEKHGAMDGICCVCESQVCHDTATVPKQQDFAFPQPSCHFAPRPPGSTGACSCKWKLWLLFGILINE